MNEIEITLSYLKEFQHKPLDENFDGRTADAFNKVISYIEEFENE